MPVFGFSVSHSAGPLVWCIKAVCARHSLWKTSFVIIIITIIIIIVIIIIGIIIITIIIMIIIIIIIIIIYSKRKTP